jgi:hypothetical protein
MGEGSWCLVHSVDYSAESPGYSDLRVCRVLLADVLNAELNNERRPTTVSGVGRERERETTTAKPGKRKRFNNANFRGLLGVLHNLLRHGTPRHKALVLWKLKI